MPSYTVKVKADGQLGVFADDLAAIFFYEHPEAFDALTGAGRPQVAVGLAALPGARPSLELGAGASFVGEWMDSAQASLGVVKLLSGGSFRVGGSWIARPWEEGEEMVVVRGAPPNLGADPLLRLDPMSADAVWGYWRREGAPCRVADCLARALLMGSPLPNLARINSVQEADWEACDRFLRFAPHLIARAPALISKTRPGHGWGGYLPRVERLALSEQLVLAATGKRRLAL